MDCLLGIVWHPLLVDIAQLPVNTLQSVMSRLDLISNIEQIRKDIAPTSIFLGEICRGELEEGAFRGSGQSGDCKMFQGFKVKGRIQFWHNHV